MSAGRLQSYVDDLMDTSDGLLQCSFQQSGSSVMRVRSTAEVEAEAARPPSSKQTSTSLLSLVPAATTTKTTTDDWQQMLLQLTLQVTETEADAQGRSGRLLRRYDSLLATVQMYEERVRQQSHDMSLNDRVSQHLEREEKEWEAQMQLRDQRTAELEIELKTLREENEAADAARAEQPDETEEEDQDQEEEEEEDDQENQELREALALREEEKRDMEAALQALRRKQKRNNLPKNLMQELRSTPQSKARRKLLQEIEELQREKEELQRDIVASEQEREKRDAHGSELPKLKETIETEKQRRTDLQSQAERAKHALERLKAKMKHMVDVQIATGGPNVSQEAVILHLLYSNAGEMDATELKQEAVAMLASFNVQSTAVSVARALYALVAKEVVQYDRSYGGGLVTLLLV